ncbi:MAG: hypothetical protein WAX85_00560 [Minisyncoccia bacterium]
MFEPYIKFFADENVRSTLKFLYYASYILVPAALILIICDLWINYRRALFFAKQTYVLLEIKLPREIFKSPRAMEFCIAGMYQLVGEKNWYEKYWKGQVRSSSSLEIVSIDGAVHFFIWIKNGMKSQVEANLYSQYPGIEIHEIPDYTIPFNYNPETHGFWASEFELTKPDPFPIKTYVDYGMEKDPKEEFKIDPLTPFIEFIGSLPRGSQVWLQIIIRAHKAEDKDPEGGGKLVDLRWQKGAQKEIDDIIKNAKGEKGPDDKYIPGTGRQLTEVEKETISALARSVSKNGFDVGMRTIYAAPKDVFDASNIGGIIGGITHFNSHLNGFRPTRGSEEKYKYFVWMSRSNKKRNKERQEMLDAYKRRSYFYSPHKRPYFVLNTEELATIFHFPGGVSTTPTFSRIESRKAEAPPDLPV